MARLKTRHISLFRLLRDHFLFLTRRQVERIFTLPTNSTNKDLLWLTEAGYLARRYRADSFAHFQEPVYYLGRLGWQMAGCSMEEYRPYQRRIETRAESDFDHTLAVYDVYLKFLLETRVDRLLKSDDLCWLEMIDFGNIPDGWIQAGGCEAFIEVDLGTESRRVVWTKLANYASFKSSGSYTRAFPGCAFKVLFITTSEEHIESLEKITTSDDIWFATMEEFLREALNHQHWFALNGFYALSIAGEKEMQGLQEGLP